MSDVTSAFSKIISAFVAVLLGFTLCFPAVAFGDTLAEDGEPSSFAQNSSFENEAEGFSDDAFACSGETMGQGDEEANDSLFSDEVQNDSNELNESNQSADETLDAENSIINGEDIALPEGSSQDDTDKQDSVPFNYSAQAHVQGYGWLSSATVSVGQINTIGTIGESRRLESISLKLEESDACYSGGISYCSHVQGYGWQDWVSDGGYAGTVGESRRLEAIKIVLTGDLEEHFDVYYRVHAQTCGWLDWAKNGEAAGSCGFAKRIEAVQIVIIEKGGEAPGDTTNPYFDKSILEPIELLTPLVTYRAHVQSYGWQAQESDGSISGTVGQAKRLESICISLGENFSNSLPGGIAYRAHVQSYGWQNWVSNGEQAGTTGKSKRLEAIEIKLTGKLAGFYDVYYRVHSQHFGWLGWAKNGEPAGTSGYSFRLEAVQILLVQKGSAAPGSSSNAYFDAKNPSGTAAEMVAVAKAQPNGRPSGGNANKYTNYRGDAWCAYFVVWCARQAGVIASVVPETYLCSAMKSYYKNEGLWHDYDYTPEAGDIIFYSEYRGGSPCHVGVVTSCSNGVVYTKEGNVGGGEVGVRTRTAGASFVSNGWYVVGYASPSYN